MPGALACGTAKRGELRRACWWRWLGAGFPVAAGQWFTSPVGRRRAWIWMAACTRRDLATPEDIRQIAEEVLTMELSPREGQAADVMAGLLAERRSRRG